MTREEAQRELRKIWPVSALVLAATVNFSIDSDFKWILLAIALAWACSLALFWFESRTRIGR